MASGSRAHLSTVKTEVKQATHTGSGVPTEAQRKHTVIGNPSPAHHLLGCDVRPRALGGMGRVCRAARGDGSPHPSAVPSPVTGEPLEPRWPTAVPVGPAWPWVGCPLACPTPVSTSELSAELSCQL